MKKYRLFLLAVLLVPLLGNIPQERLGPPAAITHPEAFTLGGDGIDIPGGGAAESTLLNDLVAYWKLDEATGTRVMTAGSCTACDMTQTGTVTGVTGKLGDAANTNGVGNNLEANYDASQQFSTAISVAFWVNRHTNSGAYKPALRIGENPGGEFFSIGDAQGIGAVYHLCTVSSNTGALSATFIATAVLDVWEFIQCYYDPADKKTYIRKNDGAWTAAATALVGTFGPQSSGQVCINADGNACTSTGAVNIDIDAVGWWNRLLTTAEWDGLYNSGAGLEYPWSTITASSPTVPADAYAHWALGEASGNRTAAGSCGSACDAVPSGTPLPGNMTAPIAEGVSLTKSLGQHLEVADSDGISGDGTNKSFSVTGWAWRSNLQGAEYLLSKDDVAGNTEWYLYNASARTSNQFNFAVSGDGGAVSVNVPAVYGAFTACEWRFFYAEYNADNGTVSVQGKDGTTKGTLTAPVAGIFNGTAPLQMGARNGAINLTGGVDDVRYFQRVLASNEIEGIYDLGKATRPAPKCVPTTTRRHGCWTETPRLLATSTGTS